MWWLLMQTGLIKPMRPYPPTRTKFDTIWFGLGVLGAFEIGYWLWPWGLIPAAACMIGGIWLNARSRARRRHG